MDDLLGKVMKSVVNKDNEELIFTTVDGEVYKFYHSQDCCENVEIEDIVGDLEDLVGEPLLLAEEVGGETPRDYTWNWGEPGSYTWTFYKFATRNGYVDVRWLGTSNGYYSESVDFCKVIQ
jgi:hypothetical protein